MAKETTISGIVCSGLQQGTFFTGLDWFQKNCSDSLGFVPYRGTFNIRIAGKEIIVWEKLQNTLEALRVVPPVSEFCEGVLYRVKLNGQDAAVVKPVVPDYPNDLLEILAPFPVRATYSLKDGDKVSLVFENYGE